MQPENAASRMLGPLEPQRQKLSDLAVERLVELLVSSGLKAGDALPSESDLARVFGVSKPVVREAMHRLVSMGVVEIRQGKPASVRAINSEPLALFFRFAMQASPRGLREAVELRRTLETDIAMQAARNISDSQLSELATVIEEMRHAGDDPEAWVAADVRFHQLLARASGNSLVLFLIEALRATMEETIRIMHAQRPLRDQSATFRRHVAIHEAVAARDPIAARGAMEAHFAATEPVVAALIASRAS
jgi:GntR family transcriptional regulator, transcriptional repressor for pyruvate dehydrogenase complex